MFCLENRRHFNFRDGCLRRGGLVISKSKKLVLFEYTLGHVKLNSINLLILTYTAAGMPDAV